MTTLAKSDLPEMDSTQQQLFAITAGAGREFPVRFGNDLWKLKCTAAHTPWSPEISLPLRIAAEEAVLELAFTPGGNLFLRHAEFTEVASMSEPFALAIRSTLNRELLDSLQTVLDAGIEISSSPITDAPPLAMAFEVLDTSGVREAKGILRIGRQVLTRIEALAPSWTSFPNTALSQLSQSVALCISTLDLGAAELATLCAGDCLILGDAAAWPFPIQISAGGAPVTTGLRAAASEPPLLDFKNQPNMNTQNTETGQAPLPVANLSLPVLVVAGRREMTLEEISSLREGASIEIGNGEEIPVELQVNNQIVAAGRLVRVADKICASITEIRLPKQA
jgi:flagellar motor switch/type III secretory pathway protein FliN